MQLIITSDLLCHLTKRAKMPKTGLEPVTYRLQGGCTTAVLLGLNIGG